MLAFVMRIRCTQCSSEANQVNNCKECQGTGELCVCAACGFVVIDECELVTTPHHVDAVCIGCRDEHT
jgi:hypothetical protein